MNTLKKEELKIGNWVEFKKKSENGFDFTTLTKSCFEGNYIEKTFNPIKLTREWLNKLGYVQVIKGGTVWMFIVNNNYIHYYNHSKATRIKYVHELQNSLNFKK